MPETMPASLADTTELHNGVSMPWVGLGTWKADDQQVQQAIATALDLGYRHIDTAAVYNNEVGVGKAIANHSVPRDQIFVTTKIWNNAIREGAEATQRALEACLERLNLDYVDLVLLHWPVEGCEKAYQGLERAYEHGKTRAIGVSNFLQHHLEMLFNHCTTRPMVNQIEFHPYLVQPALIDFCQNQQIQPEAWSPLMQGRAMSDTTIQKIAERYGRTPAQIVLRWNLQKGVVTIPKSVTPKRIEENAEVFDFTLTDADMQALDALDQDHRFGQDPNDLPF
jgi:diketogulonate reductase-like aldo/keto reductase